MRKASSATPRKASDGTHYGAKTLARGALYLLLQNRIYRGEIVHKGKSYPGEHPAIIDEPLWNEVQSILCDNRTDRIVGTAKNEVSLLSGILFDARGERMTPTHATLERAYNAIHDGAKPCRSLFPVWLSRREFCICSGDRRTTSQAEMRRTALPAFIVGRNRLRPDGGLDTRATKSRNMRQNSPWRKVSKLSPVRDLIRGGESRIRTMNLAGRIHLKDQMNSASCAPETLPSADVMRRRAALPVRLARARTNKTRFRLGLAARPL
jgi:hypothetical protein